MPNILSDLVLNEVSLVDRPANKGARVVLFKRDSSADPPDAGGDVAKDNPALAGFSLSALWKAMRERLLGKEGQSFAEIEGRRAASESVYPALETLNDSIYSILWDDEITDKAAAIKRSIDEFRDHLAAALTKSADPADPNAGASGNPATSKQETEVDSEKLEKRLSDLKLGDDVKKSIRSLVEDAVADLTKAHEAALAKAKADAEAAAKAAKAKADDEPKAIDKNALSPELRAHIEKLEAAAAEGAETAKAVAKMQEDAAVAAVAKRIGDIKVVKADDFAKHLRAIEKVDATAAEEVEKALRAASEQIAKGALFKEYGSNQAEAGSAKAEVDGRVAERQKADSKLTVHAARAEVFKADPDLKGRYNEELRKAG